MEKIQFWKERDKQIMDPALFSTMAEKLAIKIAEDNKKNDKQNKPAQLRKFFDEVVRLDMASKKRFKDWQSILPLVHMMTAKAAYASGRKLISDDFLNFIKNSVDQVQEQKDLAVFATFFEAFIGFYKMHGPSK
ncbi:MAG: type III-A CRISPR-associated protein Csm2 [Desulfobacterales bacterium]|nr:type III-A CRISPR-associated protein Csm2 [Desulfobacterales bacterium]